ncbi:hypothetical protein ACS0TY_031376 [Phlomoides rotata]
MVGSSSDGTLGDTYMIELTGKVMVVALILLIFAMAFYCCLLLWFRHDTTRRSRRLDFSAGHQEIIVTHTTIDIGLHTSVLKNIPVIHVLDELKDGAGIGINCAVCLCEVCGGEKARILPKCSHGFHVECIDMWFQSHSTCPLCRTPVSMPAQSSSHS